MARKLLPLAFALAVVSAACAEPPDPELEFGSGRRFVPLVADSLNDAGLHPSVVVDQAGNPIVSYFAFEERTAEGVLPQTRPVGAPSIPGLLMATVNEEGIWTRGAMALETAIPNVQVPFNPGFDEAIAELTARNVTGLDVVVDGGSFHAVWGSADGAFYATGSADPVATGQVQTSQVTDTPPVGPSIAVVGGTPRIAYYTSTSSSASVELASPSGEGWNVETVAPSGGCDTCATAVVAVDGGPAVAYSDGGIGVSVATQDGQGAWINEVVDSASGEGLSATATGDGLVLSYYAGSEIRLAVGDAAGPFESSIVSRVAGQSGTTDGAGTSVAVDDAGTFWVAWTDATEGVGFASGDGETFEPVDTGSNTVTGAMPSVAVAPDGATAYLAWYDTEHEDALLGVYGEIEGLALAEPSPEPTGPPVTPPAGGGGCTEAVDGVVEITARGIAFDTSCIDVPAGEPFTIAFRNEDSAPHNLSIYPSAEDIHSPILQETPFAGPDSVTYDVPALDAGEYYFQCDVHPQMNGTLTADDGGGGGTGGGGGGGGAGGGGAGGGRITVTAQNIAFDTSTIELPADTESTITFDNQDTVQHNIAIYPSAGELGDPLFQGEIFTGPDSREYEVPPLQAGEYYFQCDVHPTIMTGTVVVA